MERSCVVNACNVSVLYSLARYRTISSSDALSALNSAAKQMRLQWLSAEARAMLRSGSRRSLPGEFKTVGATTTVVTCPAESVARRRVGGAAGRTKVLS